MNSWIFDLCSGSHNQARVWCCIGTGAIGVNSWFLIYWYRYKYRCLYVYKYLRFLLLYLEMTQVYWHRTINTHSDSFGFQILLSTNTHLASSENGWLQGRQRKYSTDLEHFLVPESKEMLKVCWRNFKKGQGTSLQGLPLVKSESSV